MSNMKLLVFCVLFSCQLFECKSIESCSGFKRSSKYRLLDHGTECGTINNGMPMGQQMMGGQTAKLGEFPFIARILVKSKRNKEKGFCGGSIINNRYILTAAHCFQEEYKKFIKSGYSLFVRLGEHDITKKEDCETNICAPSPLDHYVGKVILHKEYDEDTTSNDIALLRLIKPIKFNSHVKPVCLPILCKVYKEDLLGKLVTVAGWGNLKDVSAGSKPERNTAHVLQKIVLPITSREGCSEDWQRQIPDTQICAGGAREYKHGKDTCRGDSGGPMTLFSTAVHPPRFFQVGLVSGGEACDEARTDLSAGIYTKVAAFIPWILQHIHQ